MTEGREEKLSKRNGSRKKKAAANASLSSPSTVIHDKFRTQGERNKSQGRTDMSKVNCKEEGNGRGLDKDLQLDKRKGR